MAAVAPSITSLYNNFQRQNLGHPFVLLFKSEESSTNHSLPLHCLPMSPFLIPHWQESYRTSVPKPILGNESGITMIGLA